MIQRQLIATMIAKRVILCIWVIVLLATAVVTLQHQTYAASIPNSQGVAPVITATATTTATITPTATITATITPTAIPGPLARNLYMPLIQSPAAIPPLTPIRITNTLPIDFVAAREEAQAVGLDISFNKIGFHVGAGGNINGLDEWMTALDAAGVPIVLKSANNAEPLFKAQELMKQSGVPHVLIYRDATHELDNPNFNLPAEQAAMISWQLNRDAFPPELDPAVVWIETVNEPDKNRAQWLAEFSLKTAETAVAEGYKYAAFSWSSGEPEPADWDSPAMLKFLRYAGEHPDQVAIALHEYSFRTEEIGYLYPWLIGRFQKLFAVCDKHKIPRPTILISEWGWEYNHVPDVDTALADINWASWLYAAFPQIKGAAIWYLGPGFSDIHNETQQLITPVTNYSLTTYYLIDPSDKPINELLFEPLHGQKIKLGRDHISPFHHSRLDNKI